MNHKQLLQDIKTKRGEKIAEEQSTNYKTNLEL